MVVVTGATGFLGAHLVMSLLQAGHSPLCIKRSNSNLDEFNLIAQFRLRQDLSLLTKVNWIEADIVDILSLDEVFQNAEYVFHCAAVVAFKGNSANMYKVNVEGTANVVNACLKAGVKKLIYASSTAALGRTDKDVLITEETQWTEDENNTAYAKTKHEAELEVWRGMEEGLDVLIFNPGIILGPGNWSKGSCKLFSNIKNGFSFYTNGVNGFVGVEDVAAAMVKFGFSDLKNRRFLMVSENLSYKSLFQMMADSFKVKAPGIELKPKYLPWLKIPVWLYSKVVGSGTVSIETLKTSLKRHRYDHSAIIQEGFIFEPISSVIARTSKFLN